MYCIVWGEVKESMEVSKESIVQCGKSDGLDQEQTVEKNNCSGGNEEIIYDHIKTGVAVNKDVAMRASANIITDIVAYISTDAIFT